MRVITFSTKFQTTHPKAGEPTYFVEKIMASLADCVDGWKMYKDFVLYDWYEYYKATPKHHTIRAGNRWKVGDWFSPRVWSGKPYASKQIEFAPPIQIKKVWTFLMSPSGFISVNGKPTPVNNIDQLIKNDGLGWKDFFDWFEVGMKKSEPFKGQILCWNEAIEYCPVELQSVHRSVASEAK